MSSNRTPASQANHDTMVRAAYNQLRTNGFTDVKADHIGGPQPESICWTGGTCHIPDVEGRRDSLTKLVAEIETADSLKGEHAKEQCRLFGTWATQHKQEFVLVVPAGCEEDGKRLLRDAGVPGHQVVGF